jgi:hypothetical protein
MCIHRTDLVSHHNSRTRLNEDLWNSSYVESNFASQMTENKRKARRGPCEALVLSPRSLWPIPWTCRRKSWVAVCMKQCTETVGKRREQLPRAEPMIDPLQRPTVCLACRSRRCSNNRPPISKLLAFGIVSLTFCLLSLQFPSFRAVGSPSISISHRATLDTASLATAIR